MKELLETLVTAVDERRHKHGQRYEALVRMANDADYPQEREANFKEADYHKSVEDELKVLIVEMKHIIEDYDPHLAI